MRTTQDDIRGWLERAKPEHTHMIVVCDTYDWEDYPVYVSKDESVQEVFAEYHGPNMQRVMEVYNLSMDHEKQLTEGRAFNF